MEREEWLTGESVPNDPAKRIEAYIDRLENIFLNPDERVRERNLEMFRDKIYDALIIKRDIAAEQILKDEAKAAFDRGCGRIEITEEMKNRPETQEQAEAVIRRQETSLNEWNISLQTMLHRTTHGLNTIFGIQLSSFSHWSK